MSKYKVGDRLIGILDDDDGEIYVITGVGETEYVYDIYLEGKFHMSHSFSKRRFDRETRHLSPLEEVLG